MTGKTAAKDKGDVGMHKIVGTPKEVKYRNRKGAYLIPKKDDYIGVVRIPKGYFLLGGGLKKGETDQDCIRRECMEEIGYKVSVEYKIGSAEAYIENPKMGYYHPIQTYYAGELLEMVQRPIEHNHKLVWMKFEELYGKMYLEIQNWAIAEYWNRERRF